MADEQQPGLIRLRLLGAPILRSLHGRWHPLNAKDAVLLALLALEAPLARDRLGAMLWPQASGAGMHNNLRQRLHRLRARAGAPLVEAEDALRLAAHVQHDLAEAGDQTPSVDHAGEELLAGCLLPDAPEAAAWLHAARERWLERRRARLQARIDELHSSGDLAGAIACAKALAGLDLADEPAAAQLMLLHARQGDRAAVRRALDRLEHALREELDASVSRPIHELAARLMRAPAVPLEPDARELRRKLAHPPRLVGRERVLDAVLGGLAAQRPVVVVAEAGIGKSRLAVEIAALHGTHVLAGARPGDEAVPYALVARLLQARWPLGPAEPTFSEHPAWVRRALAAVAPHLGPVATLAIQGARLRAAFQQAWPPGMLVCVDDLHFADAASIELLAAVVGAEHGAAWLLLSRAGAQPKPLRDWLDTLAPRAEWVTLLAWNDADVRQLLGNLELPGLDAGHWAPALVRHTGGVPLFVLRTLELLCERALVPGAKLPLPPSVQQIVMQRLARLSDDAQLLARVAALAGAEMSVPLAAAVLERHPSELLKPWTELDEAQLLRDGRLVHDLVADAVRQTLPEPLAQWLHGALARYLQAHDSRPSRVALHFEGAERWAEAGEMHRRAATEAQLQSRRAEEALALERAAACFDRAGLQTQAFAALAERVGALVQTDAHAHGPAAQALQERACGPEQQLLAVIVRAESLAAAGQLAELRDSMPDAMARARELGDMVNESVAARRLAFAMINTGAAPEGAALLDALAPRALASLPPRSLAEFLGDHGTVLAGCDRRIEAAAVQQRAIDQFLALGMHSDAMTGMTNLGVNLYSQGRLDDALRCIERAMQMPQFEEQSTGLGLAMRVTRAQLQRDLGDFGAALDGFESALAQFRDAGQRLWIVNTENHLALLWLQLGQPGRASQLLCGEVDSALLPFVAAVRLILQSQTARAMGAAQPELLQLAESVLQRGDRPDIRLRLWTLQCPELEPRAALELSRRIVAECEQRQLYGTLLGGQVRHVQALAQLQRLDEAAEQARRWLDGYRRVRPAASYAPAQCGAIADVLLQAQRHAQASQVAMMALEWLHDALLKMPPELRRGYLDRNVAHLRLRQMAVQLGLRWPSV